MSIARMVEEAWEREMRDPAGDSPLVICDAREVGGVRIELEVTPEMAYRALVQDGCGRAYSYITGGGTSEDAVSAALDGYLDLLNR